MDGKIVKTIKKGNTTYVFHDDYCRDKTPEEVKQILDRIAAIALPDLRAQHYREQKQETSA